MIKKKRISTLVNRVSLKSEMRYTICFLNPIHTPIFHFELWRADKKYFDSLTLKFDCWPRIYCFQSGLPQFFIISMNRVGSNMF